MQQRSFGRMGTAIWSPVGVMGVRKHSMYRRCLQLAWWRMEPILCVGKGVLPNLRTVPTSGRLSFFSPNSFFLWNAKSKLPPWCGGIKSMLCLDQSRKEHGKIKAFIYNFMHDEVLWVWICNAERHNTQTNENVLREFFATTLSIYNWHQMNKIQ